MYNIPCALDGSNAFLESVPELKKPASKKQSRLSDTMVRECLRILESGDTEKLFEIIPRIGVLRDPRFKEPLIALLSEKDLKKREFAAYALGSMGNREFLEPLKVAFGDAAWEMMLRWNSSYRS